MAAIVPYLNNEAFEPSDIETMSLALDEVCQVLKIRDCNATAREVIAIRIIELAWRGERDGIKLRNRVLLEAKGGTGL